MIEEKIDILLASYNGGQYIANQILSLQQQTHANWHLYVRDDGSTDETCEIISQLALIDTRITLIQNDRKNLGAALNFKELFKYTDAEYVICCDQDDIWFEKKLERLLCGAQQNFVEDSPCMIYCDGYGYDSEKGQINLHTIASKYTKDLKSFLFFNGGRQGCSILMNNLLAEKFRHYQGEHLYMHDSVISLLAYTFGSVYYLPEKLMLYRQHMKNVTGNMPVTKLEKIQLNLIHHKIGVIDYKIYKERQGFFEFYKQNLSEKNTKYFYEYLKFMNANKIKRLVIIILNHFSLDGSIIKLSIKTILRK